MNSNVTTVAYVAALETLCAALDAAAHLYERALTRTEAEVLAGSTASHFRLTAAQQLRLEAAAVKHPDVRA